MPQRAVSDVTAERLVAALSGQKNRHARLREARQSQQLDVVAVDQGLVVQVRRLGQQLRHLGRRNPKVMELEAVAIRHLARERGFVVFSLLERNREARQPAAILKGERGRDAARIEAAAQENADGDVADAAVQHAAVERRLKPRRGVGDPIGGFARGAHALREAPPGSDRRRSVLPEEGMAREQPRHALQRRVRSGDEAKAQQLGQPRFVERRRNARRDQGLGLRGEQQISPADGEIEGLDPEAIAGDEELPLALVPDGEREHPVQALEHLRPVEGVGPEDHLGVGVGHEVSPCASRPARSSRKL